MKYKETEKYTKEVINEILDVKEKSGLTAETLLARASKKNNPLNNLFEWDDINAGEKWRLQQARIVINEIKWYIEDKESFVFENVNVTVESNNKTETRKEYKNQIEIVSNEDYKNQLITRALNEASYWKEKYQEFLELSKIFTSIENTKKKWQKKQ